MFEFKNFTIHQDKTAMKIGTDGILLGAWAQTADAKNILDIGSGTGVLSIMAAQKNSKAIITGVEIEENAYLQSLENVDNCRWKDRIKIIRSSIEEFTQNNSNEKFDFIISNPPFFNNSTKNPDKNRTLARHTDSLPFELLFKFVGQLLCNTGRFAVIFPYQDNEQIVQYASDNNLFYYRKTVVLPTALKMPHRILAEFGRFQHDYHEQTLIVETDKRHYYTENYKNITRDFYLYFKDEI